MNDIINRPYDKNALGSEENVENVIISEFFFYLLINSYIYFFFQGKSYALLIGKINAFYGSLRSLKKNLYDK